MVAPANDNIADAEVVAVATPGGTWTSALIDNVDATMEAGEPLPTVWDSSKSVWWQYTPLESGTATFSAAGIEIVPGEVSNTDGEMGVYTSSSLPATVGTLTLVAASSDAIGTKPVVPDLAVTAGETYFVQLTAYSGNRMQYRLAVTGPASVDEAPSGAFALTLPRPTVAFTGTAPTPGSFAITLPRPTVAFTGTAPIVGSFAVTLPTPVVAFTGTTPPPRIGYGMVLDSTATVDAEAPLPATPSDSGTPAISQHVVTPTVPAPVLVNGRPS